MAYVALTEDETAVEAVYPGPRDNLSNVVEIADDDPRLDAWRPTGPLRTDAEIDEEMDAFMNTPQMTSLLEAIAVELPGPVDVEELKGTARARGRDNIPR